MDKFDSIKIGNSDSSKRDQENKYARHKLEENICNTLYLTKNLHP
jgi:hypothetical protein